MNELRESRKEFNEYQEAIARDDLVKTVKNLNFLY